MPIIETSGLTKRYGTARGIEDVSLTVEEGEIFGFIGPNGAGKSTTIRLLLDFIRPTAGSARIFGLDCQKDTVEIKKQIGYVPSEVAYYDFLRVHDLLAYAAALHGRSAEDSLRTQKLCRLLDLDTSRRIRELSFGNRKKVALVQALLHDPRLLILDEPTNGLDPLMQNALFEQLVKAKERGATVFLSSHNLAEVEKYCDRVAIIKEGHILDVVKVDAGVWNTRKTVQLTLKSGEFVPTREGVSDLSIDGDVCRFTYEGDTNALIALLSLADIADLRITPQGLEQSFLKYYGTEGEK